MTVEQVNVNFFEIFSFSFFFFFFEIYSPTLFNILFTLKKNEKQITFLTSAPNANNKFRCRNVILENIIAKYQKQINFCFSLSVFQIESFKIKPF